MSAPLQEWQAFLKGYLADQGYVPNSKGGNNPKGTYKKLVAEASAQWHKAHGTVKKAAPKRAIAKAPTKRPSKFQANEAAQFAAFCKGLQPADCKANKACTWMGGKLNRCQRRAGKQAVQAMESQRAAANKIKAAWKGHKARAEIAEIAQQAGGYYW